MSTISIDDQIFNTISGKPVGSVPHIGLHLDGVMHHPGSTPHGARGHHAAHQRTHKSVTLARHAVSKPQPARHNGMWHDVAPGPSLSTPQIQHVKPGIPVSHTPTDPHSHLHQSRPAMVERRAPTLTTIPELPIAPAPPHAHGQLPARTVSDLPHIPAGARITPKPDRRRHRVSHAFKKWAAASAVVLVIVGIASVGTWYAMPMVALSRASAQVGVSMRIPRGIPDGFTLDRRIIREPSAVAVNFRHVDGQTITIRATPSEVSAEEFEAVLRRSQPKGFERLQTSGPVVYVLKSGEGIWVKDGTLFTLNSTTQFSSEQIGAIAASM